MLFAIFYNSLNLSNVGGVIKRERQICHWGFNNNNNNNNNNSNNNNNNKGLYCFLSKNIQAKNQEHLH